VNLSLANTDWYVDQLRRQQYLSAPIPLTLDQSKYAAGNRDFVPVRPREELKNTFTDLKELMQLVGSEDARAKISWGASNINYLPTTRMKLKVDSLNYIKSIPQAAHIAQEETGDSISQAMAKAQASNKILSEIEWDLGKKSYIMKSDLLILDILASSNWTRPIYFAVTVGPEVFNGLEKYFQIEGLTYRLVPYTPQREPRVNTDIMYDNLMNKAKWGGLDKNEVWMDENNLRMASTMRMQMRTLAMSLIQEGKKKKALEVLRKCMEVLPEKNVPFYAPCPISYTYYLTQTFYLADGKEEAIKLSNRLFEILEGETEYVLSVRKTEPNVMQSYLDERLELMQQLISDAHRFKAEEVAKNYEARFKKYESMVVQAQMPLPSLMK
jgi:hypothetical protein